MILPPRRRRTLLRDALLCGVLVCVLAATGHAQGTVDTTAQQRFQNLIAQGANALQSGDNSTAEKDFRSALALDPQSIEALNDLAISLRRQERTSEAIAVYQRALQLKPEDAVTRRNLGVAYFRDHQYGPALPLLEDSANQSSSFQIVELAGLDAFALDRYAEAAHYLERAHSLNPADLETLDMLGKTYLRTKNYAGVTEVFRQIMALNPNSAAAHTMMAMAYDKMYREEDAIREFDAARAADPSYPGIHTGLGVIYWRNDNSAAAEREFREELGRYPDDAVANCILGRILRRRNQFEDASRYLTAALKANPSYREALLELGECRIALGKAAEAVEPLRKAIALDPDDAEAHFILGSALNKAGDPHAGAQERQIAGKLQARRAAQSTKTVAEH